MDRALLDQLQQFRSYPSITVLMNTDPGPQLRDDHLATAHQLIQTASERLTNRIGDAERKQLVAQLSDLIEQRRDQRTGHALALCVSPDHSAAVSLGGTVEQRVIIDETFATRDLVADLNRTATFRLATISDSVMHVFLGDRARLVEERTDRSPLLRSDKVSATVWSRQVNETLLELEKDRPLPIVIAGVKRTIANVVDPTAANMIGQLAGNHDRTGHSQLHTLAWPLVVDWKKRSQDRALARLDDARSAKRYVSGVHEIWPLANLGRIDLLVVESGYALSARVGESGQLEPTSDNDRSVTDDVVDEIIEAVLRNGGEAAIVDNETLEDHGRIAAALRFIAQANENKITDQEMIDACETRTPSGPVRLTDPGCE